jgi:hypothetical protein
MTTTETRQIDQTDDQLGLPWDLSELAPRKLLLEWIDKLLETIDWQNPDLLHFEQRNPDYRPRMFLRLLAYAYAIGTFASEDIAEGCYQEEVPRFICDGDPPSARAIIGFRRENRGLLSWILVELFKSALKHHFNTGEFLVSPGLKRFLADAATARIDLGRHMDRGAREE